MIIIECIGEYAFGGRTSDTFVLYDYDSLDELYELINNKQPIKAKQPTSYYNWSIIEQESLKDRIVYLNNYLNIREINSYIMSEEEIDQLDNTVCKSCRFNDGSLSGQLQCKYSKNEEGCWNHQEYFSLRKWIRSKFCK